MPYSCVDTFISLHDPYIVEKIKRRKMSRSNTALVRRVPVVDEPLDMTVVASAVPRSEVDELVDSNRELEEQVADMVEQLRALTESNQQLRIRNESLLSQLQSASSSASEGSVSSRGSVSTPGVYEEIGKTVRVRGRGRGVVPIARRSDTGTYWTLRTDGIPRKLPMTQACCARPSPVVL